MVRFMKTNVNTMACKLLPLLSGVALSATVFLSAAYAQVDPPSLSKRGPDPKLPTPVVLYQTVFVTDNPQRPYEKKSVKEAIATVEPNGMVLISKSSVSISTDGSPMVIDRPLTIDLSPTLTNELRARNVLTLSARLNAGTDGACFILDQTIPAKAGHHNEVVVRNINFKPGAPPAGDCITVNQGTLVLDKVKITDTSSAAFSRGLVVNQGDVRAKSSFTAKAVNVGVHVAGGAVNLDSGSSSITQSAGRSATTAPVENTSCANAVGAGNGLKNFAHSVGLFVASESDPRLNDPVVIAKSTKITGFDFGVCAQGGGLTLHKGTVTNSRIGIRSERASTVVGSKLHKNSVAGIVAVHKDGQYRDNKIYNNVVGMVISSSSAPIVAGNIFGFNGVGIKYSGNVSNIRQFVSNFAGNDVSCNIAAGNITDLSRFTRSNIRKKNKEKFCRNMRKARYCRDLRSPLKLALSAPQCSNN